MPVTDKIDDDYDDVDVGRNKDAGNGDGAIDVGGGNGVTITTEAMIKKNMFMIIVIKSKSS